MNANPYDAKAEEYNWRGPEVAFGLAYEFVWAGESILDVGIGTGLGSVLFHRAGLRVFGIDRSAEMLDMCRQKGFASDLKRHDLSVEPYPFATGSMDHAVCVGVLGFFEDVGPVFREVARIVRSRGVFTFAVADRKPGESGEYTATQDPDDLDSTVTLYRYDELAIREILRLHGFAPLRLLRFTVFMTPDGTVPLEMKAYVARRE